MEGITVSTQVFPTTTTGISGSTALDMLNYHKSVIKLFAHRLPDTKGAGVITLSLYEHTASLTTEGTQVATSVVTGTLSNSADVYLEKELTGADFAKRYAYAYVAGPTPTAVVATIERAEPRYEPV